MRTILAVLLSIGLAASAAVAQSQNFQVNRDQEVLGHPDEDLINRGAGWWIKIAKVYQHQMILDFDTEAIRDWIAVTPLQGPEDYFKAELFLHVLDKWPAAGRSINIRTLNVGVDWAQGDGPNWNDYNWSEPAGGSIHGFAEAHWRWNDNGTPGTGDDFKELDPVRSIPWKREDGSAVTGLRYLPYNYQSAVDFTASSADHGSFVGVVLDDDTDPLNTNLMIGDLLYNPKNRGLRAWSDEYGNQRVETMDWSSAFAPYVQITVIAGPVETYTPGPGQRILSADRDVPMESSPGPNGNGGIQTYARAGKGDRNSGEQMLVEWDATAVSTMTRFIEGQLAANRLTLDEAISMDLLRVEYQIAGRDADAVKTVNVETVWAANDWAEGGGTDVNDNFGWEAGETAATWREARDAWVWNDNGTPLTTADDFKEQNTNHVDWVDPVTTGTNQQFHQLQGTVNSLAFTGTLQEFTGSNWNSVRLDRAFWTDLLYNVQGTGTAQTNYTTVGIRQSGNGLGDSDDWRMWLREELGNAPQIVVSVDAVPGDAWVDGSVDVFDLAALANNYQTGPGKTWWDADFNGDGVVDVFDLAILANNYNFRTSIAGGGGPIPEPTTIAMIALGASALLVRRRRRS